MVDLVPTGIKGLDKLLGGGLSAGSCILLISPPIIEPRLLCLEYIYRGVEAGDPGLIVTTEDSPENLKIKGVEKGWILVRGEKAGLLKWLDGYSIHAKRKVKNTDSIIRIGGPLALTDMSVEISKIQTHFHKIKNHYRMVFDSLSTLLVYVNPDTVYRFVKVITTKVKDSGGIGIFTLSAGMHDPKVEMTLRHMTDGALQLDDELNLKVLSLPTGGTGKTGKLKLGKRGFKIKNK